MPSFRAFQVHQYSPDFRAATEIIEVPEVPRASPGNIVARHHYVGVNATDILITKGFYGYELPFRPGCEVAGVVTDVGEGVTDFKVGDAVVYLTIGAFAEYGEVPAAIVTKVSRVSPETLPLTVCGVSAAIALETTGEMKSGETVLITAAAGATGQVAVQLAKQAGNHVIGTTSTDEKATYLKKLGCDRVINYNKEDVGEVLKKEYPKGVDLVFESVGGAMFKAAVENLAARGRIIVFGFINEYKDGGASNEFAVRDLNKLLLMKSGSVRYFHINHFIHLMGEYFARLLKAVDEGKLLVEVDPVPFKGLEQIPDALDHMYGRKNVGKIVVQLVEE